MYSFSHLVEMMTLNLNLVLTLWKIVDGKVIENSFEKQTCFPHKIYYNLIIPSYFLVGKIGENVYCLVPFCNMAFSGKRPLSIVIFPQIIQYVCEGRYSVLCWSYVISYLKELINNVKDSKWKTWIKHSKVLAIYRTS